MTNYLESLWLTQTRYMMIQRHYGVVRYPHPGTDQSNTVATSRLTPRPRRLPDHHQSPPSSFISTSNGVHAILLRARSENRCHGRTWALRHLLAVRPPSLHVQAFNSSSRSRETATMSSEYYGRFLPATRSFTFLFTSHASWTLRRSQALVF